MTFHWAYDEDGNAQPVEKLKGGKVLVLGYPEPCDPDALFVFVDDKPITPPADGWTRDRS